MIVKMATCTRCRQLIWMGEEVGLRWTADLQPLDAQEALSVVVGGRDVYRLTQPGPDLKAARPDVLTQLRTAEPGERPVVVASHPCPSGAARSLPKAEVAPEADPCPKVPEKPAQGAARGRPAPRATSRRTEKPKCDGCGQPCADGTYASIALGDIVQWAHHVDTCG